MWKWVKYFNNDFSFVHHSALSILFIIWRAPATRCWCTWPLP